MGFPGCAKCFYVSGGPVAVCARCASKTVQHVSDQHCPVCSQTLDESDRCRNTLCRNPQRSIHRIRAIAMYSGVLADVIKKFKYGGKTGWSIIFGRLVLGYLERTYTPADVDLILPNPTWLGEGGSVIDHTERVLKTAEWEDLHDRWPFAPTSVLRKTAATPRSAGGTIAAKQATAHAVYEALALTEADVVRGHRLIVYDDVCTTGSQLDAVARFLVENGARSVEGLVLARVPWTG